MKIGKEEIRKINRTARRNSVKKNGGQDRFKPKIETGKNIYTRKIKHKSGI